MTKLSRILVSILRTAFTPFSVRESSVKQVASTVGAFGLVMVGILLLVVAGILFYFILKPLINWFPDVWQNEVSFTFGCLIVLLSYIAFRFLSERSHRHRVARAYMELLKQVRLSAHGSTAATLAKFSSSMEDLLRMSSKLSGGNTDYLPFYLEAAIAESMRRMKDNLDAGGNHIGQAISTVRIECENVPDELLRRPLHHKASALFAETLAKSCS